MVQLSDFKKDELNKILEFYSNRRNFIGLSRKIECTDKDLYQIIKKFKDENNLTWTEAVYRVFYNMEESPVCHSEGCQRQDVKFLNFSEGYNSYCPTCSMKKKIVETNLEKFGVEYATQSKEVQDKRRKTCLEKYGVDHAAKDENIKQKTINTVKENWGEEGWSHPEITKKKEQTNFERYGVKWGTQTEEVQNKRRETCKEKYGTDHWMKTDKKRKEFSEKWNKNNFEELLDYHRKFARSVGFELLEYTKAHEDSKFKCLNCEYSFYRNWNEFKSRDPTCPICSKNKKPIQYGNVEEEIIRILELEKYFTVCRRNKSIIPPQELDIYIPEKNLAIEYCGIWAHSSGGAIAKNIEPKPKTYHLDKLEKCEQNGIQLLTIFEDEWLLKPEVVLSIIRSKLNLKPKKTIRASDCEIKIVDFETKRQFLKDNHLQGDRISSLNLGLYYQNELVSLATFGKIDNKTFELVRFCPKINYTIHGAFGKLLKEFTNNYKWNKIITYADRRWSNGNLYKTLGFNFLGKTKPSHWYWGNDIIGRKHWRNFRRNQLIKEHPEYSNLTKLEIMKKLGYCWLYDCGNLKFELRNE